MTFTVVAAKFHLLFFANICVKTSVCDSPGDEMIVVVQPSHPTSSLLETVHIILSYFIDLNVLFELLFRNFDWWHGMNFTSWTQRLSSRNRVSRWSRRQNVWTITFRLNFRNKMLLSHCSGSIKVFVDATSSYEPIESNSATYASVCEQTGQNSATFCMNVKGFAVSSCRLDTLRLRQFAAWDELSRLNWKSLTCRLNACRACVLCITHCLLNWFGTPAKSQVYGEVFLPVAFQSPLDFSATARNAQSS